MMGTRFVTAGGTQVGLMMSTIHDPDRVRISPPRVPSKASRKLSMAKSAVTPLRLSPNALNVPIPLVLSMTAISRLPLYIYSANPPKRFTAAKPRLMARAVKKALRRFLEAILAKAIKAVFFPRQKGRLPAEYADPHCSTSAGRGLRK